MKKIAAIDIGSNSVRLMMWADGKTLYKQIDTTRLGEGLASSGQMKPEAIERTALAVQRFVCQARAEGASSVYAFATAAVRSATNRSQFTDRVRKLCGIEVDVVSGEREAELGINGALGKSDGGIIDVGGASTEITLRRGGQTIYSRSLNIGTVRLYDVCGRNFGRLESYISEQIKGYGEVRADGLEMRAIGGTATTIAAVSLALEKYDPSITHGAVVSFDEVDGMAREFSAMSVEDVRKVAGMDVRRADVIGGGCLLMAKIMNMLGVQSITISENDNLEGYVLAKEEV